MADRASIWIFLAIAVVIALVAFALGQVFHGAGMIFVIAASLAWCCMAQRLWGARVRG
jgi:hypothetical protein